MGGALIATSIAAVIMLGLFAKTFGWDWYLAANNAYWAGSGPLGVFPYPGILASFLFGSPVLQFILVAVMSLWFWGWVGTVFLSSTRVVFATAFDRVLPEWAAKVSPNGVPYPALALMLIPSILFSAFLVFCLVKWFQDDVYGINKRDSLIYMGVLYGVALAIYVGSRIYRRMQGMDLKLVYGEIPAE